MQKRDVADQNKDEGANEIFKGKSHYVIKSWGKGGSVQMILNKLI